MKKIIKEKLAELGITTESYCNAGDENVWPPVWGMKITGPKGTMFIEHTPSTYDTESRGKYLLKSKQYGAKKFIIASYKTQREALAGYVELKYIAGSPLRLAR